MISESRILCSVCGTPRPAGWTSSACPTCLVQYSVVATERSHLLPVGESLRLEDYELQEEIARGGMGVIYRAIQQRLGRTVAVKVLAAGDFASAAAQQRFRAEAEAAARLRHPGIVTIHDVGEAGGLPWLAMEFVDGPDLAALVRDQPLPAREAAQYLRQIAEAIQHAHVQGILHRDLKPSNILLDPVAGPRVTDFGIARCVHAPELTRTGEMLGSPGYAAPEQALEGRADVRTDVYGLGAVLYHLITARPPFQGPALDAILLQLRESDPVPPRRLNPSVPRDLETVCLTCLHKNPARRYPTAREVAEEVQRFLSGQPIRARPLGPLKIAWRWCGRQPALAATLAAAIALALGLVGQMILSHRHALALEQRRAALAERMLRVQRLAALTAEAQLRLRSQTTHHRHESLRLLQEAWRLSPSAEIRTAAATAFTLLDVTEIVPPSGAMTVANPPAPEVRAEVPVPILHRAFHAESNRLAAAGDDKVIYVLDAQTGQLRQRLRGAAGRCQSMAFSPDGHWLATVTDDQTLRLWQVRDGRELIVHNLAPMPSSVEVRWSTNGDWLTFAPGRALRITAPAVAQRFVEEREEVRAEEVGTIDLSPDGRWLVTVAESGSRLWDAVSRRDVALWSKIGPEWSAARFAPDSRRLWLGGWNSKLREVDLPDGSPEQIAEIAGVLVALSPDSRWAAALSNDHGGFQLVSTAEPREERWLKQHHPLSLAISSRAPLAATSSYDTTNVRVWSFPEGKLLREFQAACGAQLALNPEGTLLATSAGTLVELRDPASGEARGSFYAPTAVRSLRFSPDGQFLALETREGMILHRSTAPHEELIRLITASGEQPASFCFSPDSQRLAVQTATGGAVVWQLDALRRELAELGMALESQSSR